MVVIVLLLPRYSVHSESSSDNPSYMPKLSRACVDAFALIEKLDHYIILIVRAAVMSQS
jgi:hypothetical protein